MSECRTSFKDKSELTIKSKIKIILFITSWIVLSSCSDKQVEKYDANIVQTLEKKLDLSKQTNSNHIIEQKRNAFNHHKINAIYFPELEIAQSDMRGNLIKSLIIKNNNYYLLIQDISNEFYYLIDVEKGTVIKKNGQSLGLFLKNSVEVEEYNMGHKYIFIRPTEYLPYCNNITDCEYITNYDIGYHFLDTQPRGLVMQDTSYDISKKALKIGFFSFSNSQDSPDYLAAKSIVIHNPTIISFFDISRRNLEQNIVPADVLSGIQKMWKIDNKGRYLVWFGNEHPFLFMILDINRGLDIPENHLKNVYFIEYRVMLEKFGQFNDPILRANSLSQWLNDYR